MTQTDRVQRIGGALGWGVAARIARLVLSVVGSILVVRGLGTYDYGVLAVVRTVLAYVSIVVGAGLTQGLLRYLPAWRVSGQGNQVRAAVLTTLVLQAAIWIFVLVAGVLLRPVFGAVANTQVAGFLILGIALLYPEIISNTATQVANAHYDSRRVGLAVFFSALFYVGLIAWWLHRGWGVPGVLAAAAVGNVLVAAILLWRVPKYIAQVSADVAAPPKDPVRMKAVVRYSFPFLVIGLLNLITWRQSEVVFLGRYFGADTVAFFDLAYRLPQLVLEFVPGAIWPLIMAGFAEVYTRDSRALQRTADAYYKLLFLLVAPISVGGVLVGDLAIRLMYGQEYAVSGPICQVFFIVFSISFLSTPLSMVLYVIERPWLALGVSAFNAAVNVGLDWILIPRFGLWGAVVPVSLVILYSPISYWWVLKRLGVSITLPWGFLARIHAAALVMLILWPLRGMVGGVSGLVVLILLGGALFLAGVRIFRVLGVRERALIDRVNPPGWDRIAPILAGSSKEGR